MNDNEKPDNLMKIDISAQQSKDKLQTITKFIIKISGVYFSFESMVELGSLISEHIRSKNHDLVEYLWQEIEQPFCHCMCRSAVIYIAPEEKNPAMDSIANEIIKHINL